MLSTWTYMISQSTAFVEGIANIFSKYISFLFSFLFWWPIPMSESAENLTSSIISGSTNESKIYQFCQKFVSLVNMPKPLHFTQTVIFQQGFVIFWRHGQTISCWLWCQISFEKRECMKDIHFTFGGLNCSVCHRHIIITEWDIKGSWDVFKNGRTGKSMFAEHNLTWLMPLDSLWRFQLGMYVPTM